MSLQMDTFVWWQNARDAYVHQGCPKPDCASIARVPFEMMPISHSMSPFDSGLQGVDVACVMYSSRAAEINSGALSDAKVCHRVLPPSFQMVMTHL